MTKKEEERLKELQAEFVGYWVRFRRDGRLVIGQVDYVRYVGDLLRDRFVLETCAGSIDSSSILEKR